MVPAIAGETEDALKSVAEATYKQTHMDAYVHKLEDRYLNDQLKIYGGWTLTIIKAVNEKKIKYEWEF